MNLKSKLIISIVALALIVVNIKTTNAQCNGVMELYNSGTFDDGSGSENYNNDLNCKWLLWVKDGVYLTISGTTESYFDKITISEGFDYFNASVLAELDGTFNETINTTSEYVWVEFESDDMVNEAGWSASFGSPPPPPLFKYQYDASGNRISRRFIILPSENNNKSAKINENDEFKEKYKDTFGDLEIAVYPNPTKGDVTIRLDGYDNIQAASFKVLSSTGSIIKQGTITNNESNFDMETAPAGMYFLMIKAGNENTSWKLVKE